MIAKSSAHKQYSSAHKRLLHGVISQFFERIMPRYFGPDILNKVVADLITLLETQMPDTDQMKPGQCLWNAVSIETRADSSKLKLIPVILTLVNDNDIDRLSSGESVSMISQDVIARVTMEAYDQGALLSMRDIGLLTLRRGTTVSHMRIPWETRNEQILPHTGSMQDFGTCITHKAMIVEKAVYEKKDTRRVAQETKHTQQAVDRYLKDFHRVRTCYQQYPDIGFICQVTGMSGYLAKQYIKIIQTHEE
jgi:hypothetical protein